MLKKIKGFITGVAVTLVFTIMVSSVYASVGEQTINVLFDNIKVLINGVEIDLTDAKGNEIEPFIYKGSTYVPIRAVSEVLGKQVDWDSENKKVLINEPISIPMSNLGFDIHYSPLPDINSDKIIEKQANENQIENNGVIFEKTKGYEAVAAKHEFSTILIDEKGNYIVVWETPQGGGCTNIRIAKYDSNGTEVISKTYGGSDFDMVHAAKYNPNMGIVITGISQSKDGDFADYTANYGVSPFVACIDAQTLAVKWLSPVQIADFVYCVTDDAVFVVRNEGKPYSGTGDLKLSVVKLNSEGKKVWQTEPLAQWIQCISELNDGKIIVVQEFADDSGMGNNGTITCYNKDGKELSKIEADCYGDVTPTDDGGFITVSVRNIRTVPQPVYISSIWYDTETVVTKYYKDYKVEWRKTYDNTKDATGVDVVISQSDGSVMVK